MQSETYIRIRAALVEVYQRKAELDRVMHAMDEPLMPVYGPADSDASRTVYSEYGTAQNDERALIRAAALVLDEDENKTLIQDAVAQALGAIAL